VDAVALLTDDGRLHVCLLNRSLERSFDVVVQTNGYTGSATSWELQRLESDRPYAEETWAAPRLEYQIEKGVVANKQGAAHFPLAKASIAVLTLAPR